MGCNRGGRQLLKTMKTYILPFAVLLVLGACKEEETVVPVKDPFIGSWYMEDSDIKISFDVATFNNEYQVRNIIFRYSDIPEGVDFTMDLYDQFADNGGFGRIRIIGGWTVSPCESMFCEKWAGVNLWYASIVPIGARYEMKVQKIQIDMINRETVELYDRVLIRK
jgi:hypothetical protein